MERNTVKRASSRQASLKLASQDFLAWQHWGRVAAALSCPATSLATLQSAPPYLYCHLSPLLSLYCATVFYLMLQPLNFPLFRSTASLTINWECHTPHTLLLFLKKVEEGELYPLPLSHHSPTLRRCFCCRCNFPKHSFHSGRMPPQSEMQKDTWEPLASWKDNCFWENSIDY